jgi:GNAT superfamily N-acetyltransferase
VVVLRDFERRDQQAVRQLILSGMRDRWGDRYEATANPDVDDMWASYIASGGQIVVWEQDGVVIGTGTLVLEPDGGGRILRMSVERSHRRQGLGRRIISELVERAKGAGLTPVRVTTDTPWPDAVALYASCGFKIVDQTEAATHFSMLLTPD